MSMQEIVFEAVRRRTTVYGIQSLFDRMDELVKVGQRQYSPLFQRSAFFLFRSLICSLLS